MRQLKVWGLWIIATVCALDQLTKWYIVSVVMVPPHRIPVFSFFDLTLAWNRGISFGLFQQGSVEGMLLLTGVTVILISILVYWLWQSTTLWASSGLAMAIGGALGNMIDRLHLGAVIDFLYFHFGPHYFPAFNVADAAISVGIGMVVYEQLFKSPKKPKKRGRKALKS